MFRGVITISKGMNSKKKNQDRCVVSGAERRGCKRGYTKEMSGKYLTFFFFCFIFFLKPHKNIHMYSLMYGISH